PRPLSFSLTLRLSLSSLFPYTTLFRSSIVVPILLPILAQVTFWWQHLNQQFDFAVATSPDGIRLRYGLQSTTARTVPPGRVQARSEEHTSELQSRFDLVCRLLLEKKKK